MRILFLGILLLSACDVFRGGAGRLPTALSPEQFIEVYVALAKVDTPAEKNRILAQHKTSEKELQDFVQTYTRDLPALSAVFDSALAKIAAGPEDRLPVRIQHE